MENKLSKNDVARLVRAGDRDALVHAIHEAWAVGFSKDSDDGYQDLRGDIFFRLESYDEDVSGVIGRSERLSMKSITRFFALAYSEMKEANIFISDASDADFYRMLMHICLRKACGTEEISSYVDHHFMKFWLLRVCMGDAQIDWVTKYIYFAYKNGDADAGIYDPFFADLMWCLIKAKYENRWPTDVSDLNLGVYENFFSELLCQDNLPSVLYEACDFRLACAWGYDSISPTAKDVRRSKLLPPCSGEVFSTGWMGIFPVEIIALLKIRNELTGSCLTLDFSHPLMKVGYFNLPVGRAQGELAPKFEEYGKRIFGDEWQPLNSLR